MLYRFKLICEEVPDFFLVIDMDPDASFLEMRDCICNATGYAKEENASFFLCEEHWQPEKEISLTDQGSYSDQDVYLMDETPISEIIEDEGDRLTYMFDSDNDRQFFMELKEIVFGENVTGAVCQKSSGKAPQQHLVIEEPVVVSTVRQPVSEDLDIEFYGDKSYNDEEIAEGFDFSEEEQ